MLPRGLHAALTRLCPSVPRPSPCTRPARLRRDDRVRLIDARAVILTLGAA